MALPTLSAYRPSRSRMLAERLIRQREQEARCRQQWELHARYFKQQDVLCHRHSAWSSIRSYQRSMLAFQKEKLIEEKKANLERRRVQLRAMLQEERDQLEKERMEEQRRVKEERRKRLEQERLSESWRKNKPDLREVQTLEPDSALHKDDVFECWQEQVPDKKQKEASAFEEKRRFENENERRRQMEEGCQRGEELLKQMEELKRREEEATHLKQELEALLAQQWELEKMEEKRKEIEESRKKCQMRHFLVRQYHAQLKRRAQQVQEELELDRQILAALSEGEEAAAQRQRAVADAAWMKRVIEEQLELEREREAEFDMLHREEAQRMWEKREAQWEKERRARERLMHEVLMGRQQQLQLKMQKNRQAQEESVKVREELIQALEREKGQIRRTGIDAQLEEQHSKLCEDQRRAEEEEREALQTGEEDLRLEMQTMTGNGCREKIRSRPRSAWT